MEMQSMEETAAQERALQHLSTLSLKTPPALTKAV